MVSTTNECDVLIVDDSADNREIIVTTLSAHLPHVRAECASDGLEALNMLTRLRPRLLITDISMPRMNGWELIERIRRDPVLRGTTIWVVTPLDRASCQEYLQQYQVETFIEMPYNLRELRAQLETMLAANVDRF